MPIYPPPHPTGRDDKGTMPQGSMGMKKSWLVLKQRHKHNVAEKKFLAVCTLGSSCLNYKLVMSLWSMSTPLLSQSCCNVLRSELFYRVCWLPFPSLSALPTSYHLYRIPKLAAWERPDMFHAEARQS